MQDDDGDRLQQLQLEMQSVASQLAEKYPSVAEKYPSVEKGANDARVTTMEPETSQQTLGE